MTPLNGTRRRWLQVGAAALATPWLARAQGVEAGATLPQARASCPGIELRVASPGLERSARETLLGFPSNFEARGRMRPCATVVPRPTGPGRRSAFCKLS